jgi:cytochrome c-type biogenesis protein
VLFVINAFLNFFNSFLLGVLTPTTALCVLPLYPGFIAFLATQSKLKGRRSMAIMGLLVSLGIILFMLLLGLIFTTIFEVALTSVVQIISPIAMGILIIISIFLLLDIDLAKYLPKIQEPTSKNPYLASLLFGLFFGAVVLPCNPGFIGAFFAKNFATGTLSFAANMLHFLLFGLGMALPLLLFSLISLGYGQKIITWLVKFKSPINRTAGAVMLIISLYYLFFVFRIQDML